MQVGIPAQALATEPKPKALRGGAFVFLENSMNAARIAALAELMGRKPSEVEGYVIGLSIYVNKGFTLEEAIHKLNAMWERVYTAVATVHNNRGHFDTWYELMDKYADALAEDVWDTVDVATQGPKLPKPRREWALI